MSKKLKCSTILSMAYKRHFKIFNVELEVVMQHVRLIFLIQSNKALFILQMHFEQRANSDMFKRLGPGVIRIYTLLPPL